MMFPKRCSKICFPYVVNFVCMVSFLCLKQLVGRMMKFERASVKVQIGFLNIFQYEPIGHVDVQNCLLIIFYYLPNTMQFECWTTNQLSPECCICINGNFQCNRRKFQCYHAPFDQAMMSQSELVITMTVTPFLSGDRWRAAHHSSLVSRGVCRRGSWQWL